MDYERLTQAMKNATKIIYNRVSKCGSSTVSRVINRMAVKTGTFTFIRSEEFRNRRPRREKLQSLVKQLKAARAPWLYDRHLLFLEFDRYNLSNVLYINIVRRPVDRFFSRYYFIRFQHPHNMSNTDRNRPFEECVKENYTECSELHSFQIGSVPYFCGQSEFCMEPSHAAVDKAKANINKYYGVVGLTEDIIHTFALLEQTSPNIFRNMTQFASDVIINNKRNMQATRSYVKDPAAMAIMNERMTHENQLYEFIKKRFYAFLVHFKTNAFLSGQLAHLQTMADEQKKRELAARVKVARKRLEKEKRKLKRERKQ